MRVIKLGGSLLVRGGLVSGFRRWLAGQPTAGNVVVVGGGELADTIREADRLHGLDASTGHWLAVRTMSLSAELLHSLLPESRLARSLVEARLGGGDISLCVLDPWDFLHDDEQSPGRLPHSWQVTSDSIAARVAKVTGASELVLLKSRLPTAPTTFASAAIEGYVDEFFPAAAAGLPVRCVDLTLGHFPEHMLCAAP